jgi:ABC-type transport system involved in multi-copper enzyme maturation permease subunit
VTRILAIAVNTCRETVRDRVLYAPAVYAVLLFAAAYVMVRISAGQEVRIVTDLGLAALSAFGVVIAVFIGIRLLAKETERRTLYNVLSKPVSRVEFLLGKYLGLCLTLAVSVAIMTAALYAVLYVLARRLDASLAVAVYLIYWQLALVTALAVLFSTFTTAFLSAVFTVFLYVAGQFSADLRTLERLIASPALAAAAQAAYYLIPNLASFDVKGPVVHGDPVPAALVGLATLYGTLYVGATLLAAALVFRWRDLK